MPDQNKEIWILIDSRSIGGIETHVNNLIKGLHESSYNIRVVLLQDYGTHPIFNNSKLLHIPITKLTGGAATLYKALRQHQPQLIHTHGYKAGILGRCFAYFLKIPVVSTFHAGEPGVGLVRLYNYLDHMTSRLSEVISVSEQIAKKLKQPSKVLNNFIATPSVDTFNVQSINKSAAFVGRLSYEKGPDTFINIAGNFPNKTFSMYGDGNMKQQLQKQAKHNVNFYDSITDMQSHWRNIEILCITSRHEGLPMVALEAMAHGVPVIAFDVGALAKLINNNINGFIVKGSDQDTFIEYLNQWFQKTTTEKSLIINNARQCIIENYSTQSVIPQVLDVYKTAIRKVG